MLRMHAPSQRGFPRALLLCCVVAAVVSASILDNPPDPRIGESSDFAAQYYKLHRDGVVVDKLDLTQADLPPEVERRITVGTFAELPGLLQRALLWDSGFVRDGSTRRLVRIYPTCGQDMKTIAVNEGKYKRQGCTFNPNCTSSSRNGFCNMTQIGPISWCAAEGVTGPTDSAMWALHGVLPTHVPEPNIRNHNWTELGLHNQVFAIHSVMDEISYDKCPSAKDTGVIIPCVVFKPNMTGFCNVTANEHSELVKAWLDEPAGHPLKKTKDFNMLLLIPIIGGSIVVLAAMLVGCFIWRRRRKQRHRKEAAGEARDSDVGFYEEWTHTTTNTRGTRSAPRGNEIEFTYNALERMMMDDPVVGPSRVEIDDIEFETLLSRGAYGEVWRCNWNGTTVAAKRLLGHRNESLPEISRFVNEILLTASLSHPNIIGFVGVAWSNLDELSMAVEFLPLGDLQQYMSANWDMLTWKNNKLPAAIGVARAMQYLHSLSPAVVHRDIKAKNVLLTEDIDVKLIDFGVSRDRIEETMTSGVGTPYWSAPEVLDGRRYSEQSDIYSFGVLLSEIATGETPYRNLRSQKTGEPFTSVHAVLKLVVTGKLRPSFPPDCPERIVQLGMQCLDQDPAKRPTAAEIVENLLYQQMPKRLLKVTSGGNTSSFGSRGSSTADSNQPPDAAPALQHRSSTNAKRASDNLALD